MAKTGLFQGSEAIAEAARDKAAYTGFIAGLFEAEVRWNLFTEIGIPEVSPKAAAFLEELKPVLFSLDPDRVDLEGELPECIIKSLAQAGALGIKIPKSYGGQEFTQYEYQNIATLCGSVDASLTVLLSAAQSIGVPEPLRLFGTSEQKAKYLPRLAGGEISGFALTERNVGCDISKVETYAVRVKEQGETVGYRITGEKFFITNSAKQDGEFLSSMIWRSPLWMPFAWEIVAVQFGYVGLWLWNRFGKGGLFTIGILGAINIPYYEEMARRINWWQYGNCRMLSYTPYYIILGEFGIAILLALLARRVVNGQWWDAVLAGLAGGVGIFACYALAYGITDGFTVR